MGVVFMDGFDHYPIADMTRKWSSNGIGSAMVVGRTGTGQSLHVVTTSSCEKILPSTSQAWRIGFAVNLQAQTGSSFDLCSIKDGTNSQLALSWLNNRKIQLSRNGTLIGSPSTTTVTLNTWYYFEFYVSIKTSSVLGNAQVFVNGVQEINVPGSTNLQSTGNAFADRVNLSGAAFWDFYIDDFVVSQEVDSATPTILGDRKIVTLYPDANGAFSQFTNSASNSSNNYSYVNAPQVTDSTYVTADTAGFEDSYGMSDLTTIPTSIDGVQITANVRKDDVGARVGRTFFRIGGTNYESPDITLSTSYVMNTYVAAVDPSTSAAWTTSAVNGMEIGLKVQS